MLTETGKRLRTAAIVLLLALTATAVCAQTASLSAELESNEIWLGDSVRLTLYLQGSEQAIAPELHIPDVQIEDLGGTVRSSRSITNINGKVTENVRKAYVYAYSLKPEKTGRIMIPQIEAEVEGRILSTMAMSLTVKQPESSDFFDLELSFDRPRVYINEDCVLTVLFLYSRSLRSLDISIPALEDIDYEVLPPEGDGEQYEIGFNGSSEIFSRSDSGDRSGLELRLLLNPSKSGALRLSNSTASFEGVTGYQRVQDFFGRMQRQEVYGRSVIPGNDAAIEVAPFPDLGKPDGFFGLSGRISLNIEAEPKEVHLGDPITLTLTISGMNNTGISIPPLSGLLGAGIDIPDTRSTARIAGDSKIITQTIRINDPQKTMIPPVRFSYFNTDTEKYSYAESAAVPLRVLDTRVVTSAELEGNGEGTAEKGKVLLEPERKGIYYNYTGKRLLVPERTAVSVLKNSILVKFILILPPSVYLMLMIFTALIPQLHMRLAGRADRARALRILARVAAKKSEADAKGYLKRFNAALTSFLKDHGSEIDVSLINSEIEGINEVLYGRRDITDEQARQTGGNVLQRLKTAGAKNEL